MTPRRLLAAVVLAIVAMHVPASAEPHRGSGDGLRRHGGPGDGSWDHRGRGFHDRRFMRHPRSVIIVAPSPWVSFDSVSPPAYAAPPPVYMSAPVGYPSAAVFSPPSAMPRVVEYPTGRYELRGDGVTSPYVWVWIPNPPAAPPPAPSAPPAAADPPPVRSAPRAVPPSLYRWTDERGVTTWTDDLEKVPARHRAHARATAP